MSDASRVQLERIYELIQQDNYEGAIALLRPFVAENPDNADAWWLMANAVEDPSEARKALINVLKRSPAHARARETLDTLNDQFPPNDEELKLLIELDDATRDQDLSELEEPLSEEELFDLFDESSEIDLSAFDSDVDDLADLDDGGDPFAALLEGEAEEPGRKGRRRKGRRAKADKEAKAERSDSGILRPLLLVVVAALVATALLVVSGNSSSTEEGDPGQPDLVQLASVQDESVDSELMAVVGLIRADASRVANTEAASYVVSDDGRRVVYVQYCVCISLDCNGTRAEALPALVEGSFLRMLDRLDTEGKTEEFDAAGVDVLRCGTEDSIYRANVDLTDVVAYVDGNDLEQFRGAWRVVE